MNKTGILLFICIITFSCKAPEARKPETVKSGTFIKASAQRNKKRNQAEIEQIKQYIDLQGGKTFVASKNGFWYAQDTLSNVPEAKTPVFSDIVNFDYNVSNLNGTLIYSKLELGNNNYAMDQEALFSGLREGLKLMRAGDTYTFIFPSQKAYGYYGDENKIERNTPLISQVTVNSITTK